MPCAAPLAPSTTREGVCVPLWAADHPRHAAYRFWNVAAPAAGGVALLVGFGLGMLVLDQVVWR